MRAVCMPMFQEVWAADLQIRHLIDHVDYIFIFEANKTFAGRAKFMYFNRYQKEINIDPNKIKYIEVNNLPDVEKTQYFGSGGRPAPENRWPLERAMRNAAKQVIADLPDECVVYILDIDEFLSIDAIKASDDQMEENLVISFSLLDYRLSISKDGLAAEPFVGGYAATAATCKKNDIHFMRRFVLKEDRVIPSNFRLALNANEKGDPIGKFMNPGLKKAVLTGAGWHLSSMYGGYMQYQESKVQNFAHSESWNKANLADTLADQYKAMHDYVTENQSRYDYDDIDANIPDFIKNYSREFPILLQLRKP